MGYMCVTYSYRVHHCITVPQTKLDTYTRVESGTDDPDNLGHFFGESNRSHPQTKLFGCDPNITCSLENSVGILYMSASLCLMNALKYHWCETSLLSQVVLKHVLFKDFIFKKSVQGTESVSWQKMKSMALFPIKNFDVMLHYF